MRHIPAVGFTTFSADCDISRRRCDIFRRLWRFPAMRHFPALQRLHSFLKANTCKTISSFLQYKYAKKCSVRAGTRTRADACLTRSASHNVPLRSNLPYIRVDTLFNSLPMLFALRLYPIRIDIEKSTAFVNRYNFWRNNIFINWREFQRKNIVNLVDMSSLRVVKYDKLTTFEWIVYADCSIVLFCV